MAMDAICQIRMDSTLKAQVETLYRELGTTFSEAVRIFAQQSVREGRLPFLPSIRSWDEMPQTEIDAMLSESMREISEGRTVSLEKVDAHMKALFSNARNADV